MRLAITMKSRHCAVSITLLSQEEAEDEGLEIEGETDNSLITNFHIPTVMYIQAALVLCDT